jgi:hypothetical protein
MVSTIGDAYIVCFRLILSYPLHVLCFATSNHVLCVTHIISHSAWQFIFSMDVNRQSSKFESSLRWVPMVLALKEIQCFF